MTARDYLEILWRRKWTVLSTTFVTVVVVALVTYLQVPRYSASVVVRVAQTASGSVDYADYVYAERLMNTYTEILNSRPVMMEVIRRLQLPISPEDLSENIKVEVLLNTELLKITAEDKDPTQARSIADVLASLLVERSLDMYFGEGKSAREIIQEQLVAAEDILDQLRADLEELLANPETNEERINASRGKIRLEEELYTSLLMQYEEARIKEASRSNSISVVEPAMRPIKPSSPRWELNLALAFLVGLMAGIALVLLLETLNPLIRSLRDLDDEASLPTLGSIPKLAAAFRDDHEETVWSEESDSIGHEAFRLLRTNLLATERPHGTLLVTSAEARAGKSTVAAHLARSLSQTGKLVAAVDCDLRAPALHRLLGVSNELGLSDVLQGKSDLEHAMQFTVMTNLRVLPAGEVASSPVEQLGSPAMQALVEKLTHAYDIVLFDCPPLLAVADTSVLASMVDGVLIVAASDQTATRSMSLALRQLQKVGAKPLGVVLNRAEAGDGYYYGYSRTGTPKGSGGRSISGRRLLTGAALVVASLLACLWAMGAGSSLGFPGVAEQVGGIAFARSTPFVLPPETHSLPLSTLLPAEVANPSVAIGTRLPTSVIASTATEAAVPDFDVPEIISDEEAPTTRDKSGTAQASVTTELSASSEEGAKAPPTTLPSILEESSLSVPTPLPAVTEVTPAALTGPRNQIDIAEEVKVTSETQAALLSASQPAISPTPTATPFPTRTGVIYFLSTPMYADPNTLDSLTIRLPANIRIEVLNEVQGAMVDESDRWYEIRWRYRNERLTGYVPASVVRLD